MSIKDVLAAAKQEHLELMPSSRGVSRFANVYRLGSRYPGAPTPLAKVTGMIVTARVRLRVTAGCEAPLIRPAQRKFFRCLGVKRPVS